MLATRAGTWGVYARHLDTGETVAIRADEVMPAQSSVKVCILLAYTKGIRLGNDDRNRRVTLLGEDHELGSGVLRYLAPGLSPTLEDLAWLMIVLSDNIATRALIRELGGREVVNAEMDALGFSQLRLHDSLQQGASYFTATPHDLAEVYTHLDEHARQILYRVEKVDFLPRRIPHIHAAIDHDLTAPVRVYGKAGWGACECVDAGLFETDAGSWVVAAMAKDLPDLWQQTDDEGPRTLADLGETIYARWNEQGTRRSGSARITPVRATVHGRPRPAHLSSCASAEQFTRSKQAAKLHQVTHRFVASAHEDVPVALGQRPASQRSALGEPAALRSDHRLRRR